MIRRILGMIAIGTCGIAYADAVNLESLRQAIQDIAQTFPSSYPRAEEFLNRVGSLQHRVESQGLSRPLEEEVARLGREALVANPLVSGHPLLYVVRGQYKEDHHNTATLFQTGEINTSSFRGGGALKTVDLANGETKTLVDAPSGIVRDPEVRFDAAKIVFSMRRDIDDDYHIYEIDADGSGLKQLTFAKGVSDIDPLYLPDGSIVFSSTREPKYCMCNRHIMANLFRMDADGANIVQIGKSTLFEGHGSLLPDGRILYSRWEYVDRNFGDAQGLWTVYPDGTNHALYWGNNTESPGAVLNARAIPGTEQAICVFGSCHDRPWGALAIIDRRLGMDLRPPVVRTWPASAIDLVGEGDSKRFNIDTFKGVQPKYEDPFPLSASYFLCSRMTGQGETMALYLLDVFGNEIAIHEEPPGCYDPMPLAPSTPPMAIPPRRNFEDREGRFYVEDVYQGTHMEGVPRGAVKALRVVESPEKRFWTQPAWDGQGQEAPAMNWHDFSNKRILGTVPVEEDGSAYFSVPSDRFVYFQLLDENGMMIQSMRSGTMIQSGETQGCVGCHEDRRSTPRAPHAAATMAMRRAPSALNGWYGPPRLFSYMAEVQPVFDRYCVRCHDFNTPAGAKLNLAKDRDLVFNVSYNELWRKRYVHVAGAGPAQTQPAYSWGAHASRLFEAIATRPECGGLDKESFDRIVTWIDINAPYYPTYASAFPDNMAGRAPLDDAQMKRLNALASVPYGAMPAFGKDPGPQVSFDRPELSPCLANVSPENRAEVLAIIQAGRVALDARPRGDLETIAMCETDAKREAKYEARHAIEARNREAIQAGEKVFDPE